MTVGGEEVRLRIDLAYDGAAFSGWARQPDRRTVQAVLEDALARIFRIEPAAAVRVAGRTDAGVHARGQVAHVDVPREAWAAVERPLRRLARVLPADIRVHRIGVAPDGFDARFSALSRRYEYRVCDDPASADPVRRGEVLWHPRTLDPALMHEAAQRLVGEHDFAAYCRARPGATTIRRLLRFDWCRAADSPEPEVRATIEADAFCHSMVRALVGASLAVGEGRRPVSWPSDVLARGVRDSAVPVVAAHGLCLQEVRYPDEGQLAARALHTRRVRTQG